MLGFWAAYESCDHIVWLGARPGGAPPYPRRPDFAVGMLRLFGLLCYVPFAFSVLGAVLSYLTAEDGELLTAAWMLSHPNGERPPDADCSERFLERVRHAISVGRSGFAFLAVIAGFFVAFNMASTALGVAGQCIRSKRTVNPMAATEGTELQVARGQPSALRAEAVVG